MYSLFRFFFFSPFIRRSRAVWLDSLCIDFFLFAAASNLDAGYPSCLLFTATSKRMHRLALTTGVGESSCLLPKCPLVQQAFPLRFAAFLTSAASGAASLGPVARRNLANAVLINRPFQSKATNPPPNNDTDCDPSCLVCCSTPAPLNRCRPPFTPLSTPSASSPASSSSTARRWLHPPTGNRQHLPSHPHPEISDSLILVFAYSSGWLLMYSLVGWSAGSHPIRGSPFWYTRT